MGKGAKRRAHHPSTLAVLDGGRASLCPPYGASCSLCAKTNFASHFNVIWVVQIMLQK
jgi:hypothetical protein